MAKKVEPKLILEPGNIGSLKLKNRMTRMGTLGLVLRKNEEGTDLAPFCLSYYEALAKGGFALIDVANAFVEYSKPKGRMYAGVEDIPIEMLKKLSDIVHNEGAYITLQLLGPMRRYIDKDCIPYASSALTAEDLFPLCPAFQPTIEMPKELIEQYVEKFGDIAYYLKQAGFDGVHVNSSHTHFLNTFVSPAWNRRTDEYGGDTAGRTKIVCDIIRNIKQKCGDDFAVINLISGVEHNLEGGITPAESAAVAKCLQDAGSDCIHVRCEIFTKFDPNENRTSTEEPDLAIYPDLEGQDLTADGLDTSRKGVAMWSVVTSQIKKNVDIPVMSVGCLDAIVGEELIRDGKADFINIVRKSFADHGYAQKVIDGHMEDIRPCVGCLTCRDYSERGLMSQCMVNPALLTTKEYLEITEAPVKKKVLVIGSGAAGLEAARVSALRGHEVILCEKDAHIGGTLPLAALIKDFHEHFYELSQWQQLQVKKLGVDIRTNVTVDKVYVDKIKPDVIFVAVGGKENIPDIPGIDKKIVTTGEDLHKQLRTATKFFDVEKLGKLSNLYLPLGKKVILIGGAIHGLQTAVFLKNRGRDIVLLEESDIFGEGMRGYGPKDKLITWLKEGGAQLVNNVKVKEITDTGVIVEYLDGTTEEFTGDNVVTTLPMLPNRDLFEELKDAAPEVYAIGDCNPYDWGKPYPPLKVDPSNNRTVWPGFTFTAIHEAYRIAHDL